jgi:hypothetical protein
MATRDECPICGLRPAGVAERGDEHKNLIDVVDCFRCGTYQVFHHVIERYRTRAQLAPRLSYHIRKMRRTAGETPPFVTEEFAEKFSSEPLPSVAEQADNLVKCLGDMTREKDPTQWVSLKPEEIQELIARIGAYSEPSFWLIAQPGSYTDWGFFQYLRGTLPSLRLTPGGWTRYEELQRQPSEARLAFMAMKYGEPILERMLAKCFKPAVAKTGFQLQILTENAKAGLIDDRLRVEIRRARFLIADLTHQNAGAYWEAGFAEGLGRPVIYTCEKSVFDDEKTKPHFDTNHHLTVVWSESDMTKAEQELKSVVRATLPSEAWLSDPEDFSQG